MQRQGGQEERDPLGLLPLGAAAPRRSARTSAWPSAPASPDPPPLCPLVPTFSLAGHSWLQEGNVVEPDYACDVSGGHCLGASFPDTLLKCSKIKDNLSPLPSPKNTLRMAAEREPKWQWLVHFLRKIHVMSCDVT